MHTRSRSLFEHRLEINFIDEHARADALRNLANSSQRFFVYQRTARIVQVRKHNEAGARGYLACKIFKIDAKTVFKRSREPLNLCAKILRQLQQLLVCRLL